LDVQVFEVHSGGLQPRVGPEPGGSLRCGFITIRRTDAVCLMPAYETLIFSSGSSSAGGLGRGGRRAGSHRDGKTGDGGEQVRVHRSLNVEHFSLQGHGKPGKVMEFKNVYFQAWKSH